MSEEINKVGLENQSEEINIQEIFFKYLSYWKWFIVSLIVCLAIAFIYLRYSTPVYNVSAAVIIKDDKKGGNGTSELAVFEGMGLMGGSNNIDNEIEILKSKIDNQIRCKCFGITHILSTKRFYFFYRTLYK